MCLRAIAPAAAPVAAEPRPGDSFWQGRSKSDLRSYRPAARSFGFSASIEWFPATFVGSPDYR